MELLLERPLDVMPLDSFPAFHVTRRFNTEFTRALHLFLSWATPPIPILSHTTPSDLSKIHPNIIHPPTSWSS
jgi:hypothetical protein